jgi:hypothetical protein
MLTILSLNVLKICCWCLLLASLLNSGCVKSTISSATPKEGDKLAPQQRNDSQLVRPEIIRLFAEGSAEANFWERFIQDGKYRIAGADDFSMPPTIKQSQYWIDVSRAISLPCNAGDFNGDGGSDRACIMIDTTRNDSEKFGIVIIEGTRSELGTPITKPTPSLHWLYQGMDLSQTILSYTLRDGLRVREYFDDGSRRSCQVIWDRQKQEYLCINPILIRD